MARCLHLVRLLTVCLAVQLCAQASPPAQESAATHKKARATPKPAAQENREPQTNRARAEELPASPPSVTYALGLLLISADNSTLGDVLAEIGKQTGATVQTPGALYDRVAVRLGPAQPRKVLSELLQGAGFDYVIVGSKDDPEGIDGILLRRTSPAPPVIDPNPSPAKLIATAPDTADPETAAVVQPKTRQRRRDAILAAISPQGRKAVQPAPANPDIPPLEVIYDENSAPIPESLQNNPNPLQFPGMTMPPPVADRPAPPPADRNAGFKPGDFTIERAPSTPPPPGDSMINSPAASNTDSPTASSATK